MWPTSYSCLYTLCSFLPHFLYLRLLSVSCVSRIQLWVQREAGSMGKSAETHLQNQSKWRHRASYSHPAMIYNRIDLFGPDDNSWRRSHLMSIRHWLSYQLGKWYLIFSLEAKQTCPIMIVG
jgi:hypothetical protein